MKKRIVIKQRYSRSSIYEDEQKTLIQRIDINESSLKTIKEKRPNIDSFIRLVQNTKP